MNLDNIKILLQDISQFEILEIIDNSAKHKGHTGVENSSTMLTHVELRILNKNNLNKICLLYTSPSPRDLDLSRMPSSA